MLEAFENARNTSNRPTVILAHTSKGKGVSFLENKEGWHGKALKGGEQTQAALKELRAQFLSHDGARAWPAPPQKPQRAAATEPVALSRLARPEYDPGKPAATREAFGQALAQLGKLDPRIVALDGDVKNSTHLEMFEATAPARFVEGYIAEQNMVGMAMGLAASGKVPFVATFACFLTRAADFIRLAGLAQSNIKFVGTHAGVSIGEDGASQMGLEDLALFRAVPNSVVLYPSDAVSTWRAVELVARHQGLCYIRTGRPKAPILYSNDETFAIGKAKVVRQSDNDALTVVAAGVTLFRGLTRLRGTQEGEDRGARRGFVQRRAGGHRNSAGSCASRQQYCGHRRGSLRGGRTGRSRSRKRWGPTACVCTAWRCARSPTAANPRNCSAVTRLMPQPIVEQVRALLATSATL